MTATDIAEEVKRCLEDHFNEYHYIETGKLLEVSVIPQTTVVEKNNLAQSKLTRSSFVIKIGTYQSRPEPGDLEEWEI